MGSASRSAIRSAGSPLTSPCLITGQTRNETPGRCAFDLRTVEHRRRITPTFESVIITFFRKLGVNTDLMYILGFISIGASIATWAAAKNSGDADTTAHAERFGIFIGLWAPTFMALGNAIANDKSQIKI